MVDALPVILSIESAVNARFGPTGNKGIGVCRNIKGTTTPSQHAWGNAIDLDVYGYTAQAPYVSFLETLPQAGTILWASNRPSDHTDHIHVEGLPKQTGTPPCMGGTGTMAVITYESCERNVVTGTWSCKGSDGNTYDVPHLATGPDGELLVGDPTGSNTSLRPPHNFNPVGRIMDVFTEPLGQIALRALYGVVGIGAIILGGMLIGNEVKTTAISQVVGPVAGKITSAVKS